MPVLCIIPASLRLRKAPHPLLLAVVLLFVTNCGLARGPEPAQTIPLEPLGFQPQLPQFMLAGSSMMTVDFVDTKHLLVTYNVKRLLKRIPECPPSDQDRVIEAVLLELPTKKVLARTSWRTHDHGMYLWNLGKGRFMLRIRDDLWTFAPMVNLKKGDAFLKQGFIRTDRRIGGVLLSPEADLLILETMDPRRAEVDPYATDRKNSEEKPVQINFFRMVDKGGDQIDAHPGGALRSRVPGRIPANSAGYIAILDEGQQHWGFNFQTYGGKLKELAAFDSTCRPSPMLVSRSEFIAFGCHISHTPQVVGAFNMRGEEMWEQILSESYVSPTFAFAPEAGRFVLSRVLTRSSMVDSEAVSPELFDSQSIIVYQTDSGRQLLRIDASPISRAGQNYALAPDGLSLAVIRNGAVEIYNLPPLTSKEREAVQIADASAPQVDGDPSLALSSDGQSGSSDDSAAATSPAAPDPGPADSVNAAATNSNPGAASIPSANTTTTPAAANTTPSKGSSGAEDTGQVQQGGGAAAPETTPTAAGDQPESKPRKPPTLYAPGESQGNPSQQDSPR